jgi:uncharacterized membrane protein
MSVIARDTNGKVVVTQPGNIGPIGTGVGLLTWSLNRLFNGSNALELGRETFGGAFYDLAKCGVGEDFLCEVGNSLQPGKAAVLAEVWEEGSLLVDTRMERLNGIVFRRIRREILTPLIKRDIAVIRAELDELETEQDQPIRKSKGKLQKKIDATRDKLKAMQIGIQARIESSRQETKAKIDSLQEQAAKARGDKKSGMERRIVELQVEQERRSDLLKQAQELINKSLFVNN